MYIILYTWYNHQDIKDTDPKFVEHKLCITKRVHNNMDRIHDAGKQFFVLRLVKVASINKVSQTLTSS